MAETKQLTRLLKDVRALGSPLQRMAVLARAWRTISRLGPAERAALAAEVGIDGAEEVIERLASRHGGLKPAALLQALDRAREARPEQVQELFRGLRDPGRRRELIGRGLAAVATRLAPGDPPPREAEAPEAHPQLEGAAAAPGSVVEPSPQASLQEPPHHPRTAPSRPASVPISTAGGDQGAPVLGPETSPTSQPPRPMAPPEHALREPPPAPPATPAAESATELTARIAEASGLVRRLGVLRSHAHHAQGLDAAGVRRLLDLFPHTWSRRRALSTLLEQGVPADPDEALALIEELPSSGARRFCLGTLKGVKSWQAPQRGSPWGRVLSNPQGGRSWRGTNEDVLPRSDR